MPRKWGQIPKMGSDTENLNIESIRELESTRKKLEILESRISELGSEPIGNPHTRELTRRSLKKLVNQLK